MKEIIGNDYNYKILLLILNFYGYSEWGLSVQKIATEKNANKNSNSQAKKVSKRYL